MEDPLLVFNEIMNTIDEVYEDDHIFIEWDCPNCGSEFVNRLLKNKAIPIFCKNCKTLLKF